MIPPPTLPRRSLSVVIPAFNEGRRLATTLVQITNFLTTWADEWEVLVVDDGSQDDTAQLVGNFATGVEFVRLLGYAQNRGKGYAVRCGVLASQYETILMTDADLSTPIAEIEKLYALLADADVVIASRSINDAKLLEKQGPFRMICGKAFNLILRLLRLTSFGDTQCGFKLWRRSVAQQVFVECHIDGFAFDVETLLLARRRGLRISEVGVVWKNSPESKVRIVTDSLAMFVDVLRLRRRIGMWRYSENGRNQ